MNDTQSAKVNILFVDDEINVISGLKRMLNPYKNEWGLFFSTSGEEALALLENNPITMIITDMRMPGMNGAELLSKVQLKYPQMIKIILSGHSDEDLILKSTNAAHQFITKPCSAELLINTIQKTIRMKDYLGNENLRKIINGIDALPGRPELLFKLEEELNGSDVSLSKVTHLISEDFILSAKILQMVNSAFFGLANDVVDLDNAISLLGVNTIKSLIIFLKLTDYISIPTNVPFNFELLIEHSIKVAKAAQAVFQFETENPHGAKEAYMAGLLHDIGKLVLLKYHSYVEHCIQQGSSTYARENEKLGISHAEVGAYLLGLWNLPDRVVNAVASHHKPPDTSVMDLNSAVFFANILVEEEFAGESYTQDPELLKKMERWHSLIKNI
jgi:putative nucleotidyltransferase with HDIG domain